MPGPRPNTTPAQRERVLALVDAGRSYSAVAAEVFGEARFRGRVERIVRRERDRRPAFPALDDLLARLGGEDRGGAARPEQDSLLEQLVPLYGAMLKRRLETDLPVNGRELLALVQLEFRLKNQRELEQMNALTREEG